MLFHNLGPFGFILIKCCIGGPSTNLSKVPSAHIFDCDIITAPEQLDRFVYFVTKHFHEKPLGASDSQQYLPIILIHVK
jgi:hypothetical protein